MPKMCIQCKKEPHPYDRSRSFHKFPDNEELKRKWMTAIGISKIAKTSLICNDHFHISSFHNTDGYTTKRRLLSNAVPIDLRSSVVLDHEDQNSSASSNVKCDHQVLNDVQNVADENISGHTSASIADESIPSKNHLKRKRTIDNVIQRKKVRLMNGKATEYFMRKDFSSDEAWTRFLKCMAFQKTKKSSTYMKNFRAKKEINTLKGLVTHLKEQQLTDASDFFQELPPHLQELLTRMKNKKPTAPFPAHLKNFARTLHFHSPAAYEVVRRSFLKCLPCVETLNKWFSSKNFKPGVSDEVIRHVSSMVDKESKKGKELVFNVTFDEMNIRKWKFWDKRVHEWKGVVDLGGQLSEVNENNEYRIAGKVLVFMLVAINGGFKTPVAHYIIDSLNGREKAVLLKDLLIKLNQNDIDVVSVTFDGDKAHTKACELLGANLNYRDKINFKPFFEHPATSKAVYIFFDPCHMLKLVRNYFALKGPIIYDKKEFILWDYIVKLHNKQNTEGLHCACKIRHRHVYFKDEKMKVCLAAQVLSSSTAIALRFLEHELKDKSFQYASRTASFCQIVNDMFDVLNIRNKFCKTPGRRGITKEYLPILKTKIDEYIAFIEKLEINEPIKVRQTEKDKENLSVVKIPPNYVRKSVLESDSVKTGFLGFIVCLTNVYSLCTDLIENKNVDFVLTYKLSQDHVEMFFALLRRMNGYNNNPTSVQYQSAYTKLLTNNINVIVPASANCTPQDDTTLFIPHSTNISETQEIKDRDLDNNTLKSNERTQRSKKQENFPVHEYLQGNAIIFDHNYCGNAGSYVSQYIHEIIQYAAGFIVRSLRNKLTCKPCCDMLERSPEDSNKSRLTVLRNRGGLRFASDDVIYICTSAEKIIRIHNDSLLTKNINHKLITETLKILPHDILDANNHALEQEPLHDHRHQLILFILQKFIDLRLNHYGNSSNNDMKRIRMRNNKLTLFSGQ